MSRPRHFLALLLAVGLAAGLAACAPAPRTPEQDQRDDTARSARLTAIPGVLAADASPLSSSILVDRDAGLATWTKAAYAAQRLVVKDGRTRLTMRVVYPGDQEAADGVGITSIKPAPAAWAREIAAWRDLVRSRDFRVVGIHSYAADTEREPASLQTFEVTLQGWRGTGPAPTDDELRARLSQLATAHGFAADDVVLDSDSDMAPVGPREFGDPPARSDLDALLPDADKAAALAKRLGAISGVSHAVVVPGLSTFIGARLTGASPEARAAAAIRVAHAVSTSPFGDRALEFGWDSADAHYTWRGYDPALDSRYLAGTTLLERIHASAAVASVFPQDVWLGPETASFQADSSIVSLADLTAQVAAAGFDPATTIIAVR
jgi:hypothetical protein